MVLCVRCVKAAMTLALDVQPESLAEIGRLSDVEAWIGKVFRPPVSVLNIHANFVWSLEYDSPI